MGLGVWPYALWYEFTFTEFAAHANVLHQAIDGRRLARCFTRSSSLLLSLGNTTSIPELLIGFSPISSPNQRSTRITSSSTFLAAFSVLEPCSDARYSHGGSTIMKVMYDIDTELRQDPFVVTAEEALEKMAFAAQPGRFMVDFFPVCEFAHWSDPFIVQHSSIH